MSEILLCSIYWDLGKSVPKKDKVAATTASFAEIETEDFDEDANLQADIWNGMVRH